LWAPQYWKVLSPLWFKIKKLLHRSHILSPKKVEVVEGPIAEGTEKSRVEVAVVSDLESGRFAARPSTAPEGTYPMDVVDLYLIESRTPEEALLRIIRNLKELKPILAAVAVVICLVVFAGSTSAGISPAFLTLDKNALSITSKCGIWVPSQAASITNPMGQIMNQVESYHNGCYEVEPSQQKCDLLSERDLHVNFTDCTPCPFKGGICWNGIAPGIRLDTGYLDIHHLGINTAHRLLFRRKVECSPLKTDAYFMLEFDDSTNYTTIRFYLGNQADGTNFTYQQIRSLQFEEDFSPTGYLVKTISEALKCVPDPHLCHH
jgi:hypothetical protein